MNEDRRRGDMKVKGRKAAKRRRDDVVGTLKNFVRAIRAELVIRPLIPKAFEFQLSKPRIKVDYITFGGAMLN